MIEAFGLISNKKYGQGRNKAELFRNLDKEYEFRSRGDDSKQLNSVYPEPLVLSINGVRAEPPRLQQSTLRW